MQCVSFDQSLVQIKEAIQSFKQQWETKILIIA